MEPKDDFRQSVLSDSARHRAEKFDWSECATPDFRPIAQAWLSVEDLRCEPVRIGLFRKASKLGDLLLKHIWNDKTSQINGIKFRAPIHWDQIRELPEKSDGGKARFMCRSRGCPERDYMIHDLESVLEQLKAEVSRLVIP